MEERDAIHLIQYIPIVYAVNKKCYTHPLINYVYTQREENDPNILPYILYK